MSTPAPTDPREEKDFATLLAEGLHERAKERAELQSTNSKLAAENAELKSEVKRHETLGKVMAEDLDRLIAELEAAQKQIMMDTECIERIRKHGMELEVELEAARKELHESRMSNSELQIELQNCPTCAKNIERLDTALAAKDAAEKALQRSYDQLKIGRRFLPSHGSFGEDGINQYEGAMHDAKAILDRAALTPAPTQEPPAGGVTTDDDLSPIGQRKLTAHEGRDKPADVQPEGRGEWMPIETAPKDGRKIILFRGGYVRIGYWDAQKYHSKPRPFWNDIGHWGVEACRRLIPTKWQPLPQPPILPTEGSGASQIADGLADQRGDF